MKIHKQVRCIIVEIHMQSAIILTLNSFFLIFSNDCYAVQNKSMDHFNPFSEMFMSNISSSFCSLRKGGIHILEVVARKKAC